MIRIISAILLTGTLWVSAQAQFFNPVVFPPFKSVNYVITTIGTNQVTSGNSTVTTSGTIPAGSLVVLVAGESAATVVGSVSGGGTWNLKNSKQNNNSAGMGQIFTIDNSAQINNGTVITFTPNNSTHNNSIGVYYITGTDGNAPAVNATPTFGNTSPATIGPITVSIDQLVLGFATMQGGAASTWTQSSGYTNAFTPQSAGLNNQGVISGYLTAASTTQTYAPTTSANRGWAAFILAYNHP